MLNKIIKYFLDNKLVTALVILTVLGWGTVTAPFGWDTGLPSDAVSVDAIPNIGENQQIIFTEWKGRSPQDIDDQITYPLTTSLLGISGVKSIRSSSLFGVSSIYIIFEEDIEFYWSRVRIIEKLNSLPKNLLPDGVQPTLGPDATALGQVFWYTIEGRNLKGEPTGGWDLHELRSTQDFYVKYALNAVQGVSEVASIGGFVKEYQIDIDPDAMKNYNISLEQILRTVRESNKDVGAKTLEINQVEYLVRGLGNIKSIEDLGNAVVAVQENTPVYLKDISHISMGPATRRGVLDKGGAEVVGGVVVARYGSNPLEVITGVKEKIKAIASGLPKKTLADGTESQLKIVPFYDRTQLIHQTLGTLEEALSLEMLITILVVILMVLNLRASLLIASLLPLAVLMVFIAMRYFHIDANIVALSGIAIAIGTMVDLGIVLSENILRHLKGTKNTQPIKDIIYKASSEVSSAIVTAVATTIVSFIPVFMMEGAEGKMFSPLAFTKTFALVGALVVSLFILPTMAQWLFGINLKGKKTHVLKNSLLLLIGGFSFFSGYYWASFTLLALSLSELLLSYFRDKIPSTKFTQFITEHSSVIITIIAVVWLLTKYWMPLGVGQSFPLNLTFVTLVLALILGGFLLLERSYQTILSWCLANKKTFFILPITAVLFALTTWLGFANTFGFIAKGFDKLNVNIRTTTIWSSLTHTFTGIDKEFMPTLDEGSFLLMPTSMPHAGMSQNKRILQQLDMLVTAIPEVELVVGKMGRAETALDPAPISMYENVINYKPEYLLNKKGHRQRFKINANGDYRLVNNQLLAKNKSWYFDGKDTVTLKQDNAFLSTINTLLMENDNGDYFRNWRPQIKSTDDIWQEISRVTQLAGVTSAPKLQPIETRLVMLQTGMRAPMGIKVYGSDLQSIEAFGLELEQLLKEVPSIKTDAVFADRIVGKPYVHLTIDRNKIARYGLSIEQVQRTIEVAIGGKELTKTVEGRERFSVRVRYPRELRDNPDVLVDISITTANGTQVPLGDLVKISYTKGPQMIKSENTFLVGYVLFDKKEKYAEMKVIEDAQQLIASKIADGDLVIPSGISYKFSGNYENQVRAEKRLLLIIPLVLVIILLILYFEFRSISVALMVFSGIAMAFSGAFILLWLYGQTWFFDFSFFSTNMRDLFQLKTINLSVAVWVGFIALFGIATDDGVLIGTYLTQSIKVKKPQSVAEVRKAVIDAGSKRIKPAIMTSATTIIALLPVLTSTGRGADIMIPMAIPAFGGMLVASITYFIVPVLFALREERKLKK